MIEPRRIYSTVNFTRPEKVEKIAAVMRLNGWEGRPLLVEEGLDDRIFAWTGSHRIAAAKVIGLTTIPCRVLTRVESEAALQRVADPVGYLSLRDALTMKANGGGKFDPQRLEGLRGLGGLDDLAEALQEDLLAEVW